MNTPTPRYGSNDVIGCGVTASGNVYFSFNGFPLQLIPAKLEGIIYPIVSMRGRQTKISITQLNLSKIAQTDKAKLARQHLNGFALKFNPTFKVSWNIPLLKSTIELNSHSLIDNIMSEENCPEIGELKMVISKIMHNVPP